MAPAAPKPTIIRAQALGSGTLASWIVMVESELPTVDADQELEFERPVGRGVACERGPLATVWMAPPKTPASCKPM